jgi:citrate lyase beta subunit
MSNPSQRVRRVLLFTPGDDLRKVEKAAKSGADSVILDLEDGVALNRKVEARQAVVKALQSIDFGRSEKLVRINPIDSSLEVDDLNAIINTPLDGYVIPKVENPKQIRWLGRRLDTANVNPSVRLLAIIETAKGIINLKEIAGAHPRLDALIFGAEDFASSIGAIRTREGWEVFYARSAVVTHAAAFGLQAIDSIYADFNDTVGLTTETEQSLRLGYTGKLAIHPRQIDPITAVFTPSDEAVAQAKRLVNAHNEHQAGGTGVFALDGKMVDMPMVRAAERVLARAKAAGKT